MNSQSHHRQNYRLLIDSNPNSGQYNMAVDETLLEFSTDNEAPVFRLYEWSEPTISLGYFQKQSPVSPELRFKDLPHVRRLSGGGAILHHHELTYSLTIPQSCFLAKEPSIIYQFMHEIIIESLKEFQVESGMRSQTDKEMDKRFLCFGRGDANDILLNDQKIVGSAQRRRKGNVLQHGSFLLKTSEHAPEFPGINELAQRTLPLDQLKKVLIHNLSKKMNLQEYPSTLTIEEEMNVEKLIVEKYQFLKWSK